MTFSLGPWIKGKLSTIEAGMQQVAENVAQYIAF